MSKIIKPSKIIQLQNNASVDTVKSIKLFIDTSTRSTWMRSLSSGEYRSGWVDSDYTLVSVMSWLFDEDLVSRTLIAENVITTDRTEIISASINQAVYRRVAFGAKYRRNSDNAIFELPLKVSTYQTNFSGSTTFTSSLTVYGGSAGLNSSFFTVSGIGSKLGKTYNFYNSVGIVLYYARGSAICQLDVNDLYSNPNEATVISVTGTAFDRAVVIAEKKPNPDVIVRSSLFLKTNLPVNVAGVISISANDGNIPVGGITAIYDDNAFSEFIHINQVGYHPNFDKIATLSEYQGNGGEVNLAGLTTFYIVDAITLAVVYTGTIVSKKETQFGNTKWYQQVKEINFTEFTTPGCYKIKVPWVGTSTPFHIDKGITWHIGRLVSRGLYNMRCGCDLTIPYTRQTHPACHMTAEIPVPADQYPVIWSQFNTNKAAYQAQPPAKNETELIYPYLRTGTVDCSGGHHDAGDYGRYSSNNAGTCWWLTHATDCLSAGGIDNIGLPNSGQGKSDLLAEAIIDADMFCKWQESDGGIYSLARPKARYYEDNVSLQAGDTGDVNAMFPKDIASNNYYCTALAKLARSPYLAAEYGLSAVQKYQTAALSAWQFVENAFAKYGKAGSIQAIRNGWQNTLDDDYASACVEMYLMTGEQKYHTQLLSSASLTNALPWDPSNTAFIQWGWNRDTRDPGYWACASYAFAEKEGKRTLDPVFLGKAKAAIISWGDYLLNSVEKSAFRDGLSQQYKRNNDGFWIFSPAESVGLTCAYEISTDPVMKKRYLNAYIACWNHFLGSNASNTSFMSGVGLNMFWESISQYRENNYARILPPTGIIIADCIKQWYQANLPSKDSVKNQFYPDSNSRPFFNRVVDSFFVGSELIVVQQGQATAGGMWLAAVTTPELKTQQYKGIEGVITGLSYYPEYGAPVRAELVAPSVTASDLSKARIVWEETYTKPVMGGAESCYLSGHKYSFNPQPGGVRTLEAEAQLIDGRVVIARSTYVYAKVPNRRISDFLDMNDPNIIGKLTWEGNSWIGTGLSAIPTGDPYIDTVSWKNTPAAKVSINQANSKIAIGITKEQMKGTTTSPFTGVYLDFMVYPIWNTTRESSFVYQWFASYGSLNQFLIDGYPYREAVGALPFANMAETRSVMPGNTWHHVRVKLTALQCTVQVNGGTIRSMDSTAWNAVTSAATLTFGAWGGWIGPVVLRKIQ